MSGLGSFFGMGVIGSALQTFQEATDVTSNDIANVNTPGASRQVVNIAEAPATDDSPFASAHFPGTFGNGSLVASVQRIHDDYYDTLYRNASASGSYFTAQQNQLQALQSSFGEPNNGINSYFTAFQTAVSQLINQTGSSSVSASANVLSSAQALTQALNGASSAIASQKSQTVSEATTATNAVNNLLDQIAGLNGQIRASTAVGDSPNTLMDQRDELIDQLSTYVQTQTSIQPDGSALVTVGGQALVNDTVAYHLSAPAVVTSSNGTAQLQIGGGVNVGSGQLGAYEDLYNNKLSTYGQQLDGFASSLASEVNRVTESGYDSNGIAGAALFSSAVSGQPISASTIQVNITNPSQLPTALASTAAGTLVTNMNSANNVVDTSAAINGNGALANAPAAAGVSGTLTVTVDGVAQTFNYDTNTTDSTIDAFISHFNSAHLGVTASFDSTGQRIVFTRDPSNTDLVHRAAQQAAGSATDPTFTITDSNDPATPAASLLGVLGAGAIQGVTQNGTNAVGTNDVGAANALLQLFSTNVGVPAVQGTSATAVGAPGTYTVALPAGVTTVQPGDILTVDATPGGGAPQENVVVSSVSVDPVTGIESFTATFKNAHSAGFSIASAQTQTLGEAYSSLVSQMAVDTQTAISGSSSQQTLTSSIDQTRQSIDGINIDEETQNLIKYQNAYAAAARTESVLNSMLQTVINNLGVGG